MKTMFKLSLGTALVVAAIGFAPKAYAFHDGGVAECEGCHTMHNSEGGKAVTTLGGLTQFTAGPYLLQGNTQSEACLNCHNALTTGSYHISTDGTLLTPGVAPINYSAGGDFGWLKKTYTFTGRGGPVTDPGEGHGHNIVAPAFGYNPSTVNTVAPGGSYPATSLQCSSCHDPHGKYRQFADGTVAPTGLPISGSGSYVTSALPIAGVTSIGVYRLLGGNGYQPKSLAGSFAFGNYQPAAIAAGTYNKVESDNLAGQVRVAYGQNMSEWCANCHGAILQNGYTSGHGGLTHPAGNSAKFTSVETGNYTSYVKSGNLSNSDTTKAFWTLTPFEIGSNSLTVLQAAQKTFNAPDTTSNVACVTCHRAHASGFASMLRFGTQYEMITGVDTGDATNTPKYNPTSSAYISYGKTEAESVAAYYGRPATVWAPYQRDVCNKCHAKD